MRILLIEDDEPIADVIRLGLEEARHQVEVALDGDEGLEMVLEGGFALIILDVMLPGCDGWSLCRRLRERRDRTPILMLTARDSLEDRVRGLDTGADDYLSKPFAFPELLARVRALLRRDKMHKTRTIHIADLEIDTALHRVVRAGEEITLTPREYTLLEAMALREGIVVSREMIQERIWLDDSSYSNTVDVCIGQLRKKIDTGHPIRLIHTAHRQGYLIKAPDSILENA